MHPECEFVGPLLTPEFAVARVAGIVVAAWSLSDLNRLRRGGRYGMDCRISLPPAARSGCCNHVVNPLATALGYGEIRREDAIATREGPEDGGYTLRTSTGSTLRVWPLGSDTDLDTPLRRGTADTHQSFAAGGKGAAGLRRMHRHRDQWRGAQIVAVRSRRT